MSWRSHSKRLGMKTKKGAASSTSMPIARKEPTHAASEALSSRFGLFNNLAQIIFPSTQDKGTKLQLIWVEAIFSTPERYLSLDVWPAREARNAAAAYTTCSSD